MKLVVGLGNPGKQYEKTRHNSGFRAIDFYATKNNLVFKSKFDGQFCETTINKEKMIILKPQTYMNLSGQCVRKFQNYYNIDIKDIIIIYDDVDFEVGKFKIKRNGSSAGHNGIKNIIENLKTENIQRIRIGISKNSISLDEYVLSKFSNEENEKLEQVIEKVSYIINDFFEMSIDQLMEKYNQDHDE